MKKYEKRSNNLWSKQHVDSNMKKWLYITFVLFSNFGDGYSYSTHKKSETRRKTTTFSYFIFFPFKKTSTKEIMKHLCRTFHSYILMLKNLMYNKVLTYFYQYCSMNGKKTERRV